MRVEDSSFGETMNPGTVPLGFKVLGLGFRVRVEGSLGTRV